jgi:hypothetical protein
MTVDSIERTVTTTASAPVVAESATPVTTARETVRTDSHTIASPGRPELGRRITVLVFGLIQVVIGARIVLLLLDAREGNGLVSGILNLSQVFVGPFEGILRTDALRAGGTIFDIAAVVAIVGWTIIELIVIKALAIFRRETV